MQPLRENPILRHELSLVFDRRGAFLRLLAFTAVVALAVLAIWPREAKFINMRDRVSRDALANLAGALQMLVLLFGPAYAATSVTRDRETGFLETLLSANFTPTQIFRGKWIAASAFLWMLVAATMPVAAVVYQLGGISPGEFIAIYIELFLWSLVICAFGVRCSICSFRSAEALAQVYVRIVVPGALWVLFPQLHFVWLLLPLFLLPKLINLKNIQNCLKYPFDYPPEEIEPDRPKVTQTAETLMRFVLIPWRREHPMKDWENAVAVREMRYQGLHSVGRLLHVTPWIVLGGVIIGIALIAFMHRAHLFHLVALMATSFVVPALGAVAFTSENDQRTMESLIISPARRSAIAAGKIWVTFRTGLLLFALLEVIALPIIILFDAGSLNIFPQATLLGVMALMLISCMSVLWSVFSHSTPQAVIGSYTSVFILLVGVPVLCRHLYIYNDLALQNYAWLTVLTPSMPFLMLAPFWTWTAEFAAEFGSPVQAWDTTSSAFMLVALAASALQFLILTAAVERTWRRWFRKKIASAGS